MTYELIEAGLRPDFRLVPVFLWGEDADYDSEGDAEHPASRTWKDLWCRLRRAPHDEIEVEHVSDSPLVLQVSASTPELSARLAFFLALETRATIRERGGSPISLDDVAARAGPFQLAVARARAANSRLRHATGDDPFPAS